MTTTEEFRIRSMVYWCKMNAIKTGSFHFFGEGRDIDYVISWDDLMVMEKIIPYTAMLITSPNQCKSEFVTDCEYGDQFHSVKFKLDDQLYNIILCNSREVNIWYWANKDFLEILKEENPDKYLCKNYGSKNLKN